MVAGVRKGREKGFYTREKREGRARREGKGISGHFLEAFFLLIACKTLVCVSVLFCFVCLFVFQKRILFKRITAQHSFYPGGEYSSEFFVGVCHPVLQILPLFQTKKM